MSPNVLCLRLGSPYFETQGNPRVLRGHDGNVLVRTSAHCLASTSEWGSLPDSVCSDLLSPASVPRARPMTCSALLAVIRRTGADPLMIPAGIQFHLWLIGMLTGGRVTLIAAGCCQACGSFLGGWGRRGQKEECLKIEPISTAMGKELPFKTPTKQFAAHNQGSGNVLSHFPLQYKHGHFRPVSEEQMSIGARLWRRMPATARH